MLAEGKTVRFRVRGNSMYPLLRDRTDEVALRPRNKEETPHKGDIVLFHYQGRHILHRVVRIKGNRLEMRGDNVAVHRKHAVRRRGRNRNNRIPQAQGRE